MVQNATQRTGYDAGFATHAQIFIDHKRSRLLILGYGTHDTDVRTYGIMTLLTNNWDVLMGSATSCFHYPNSGQIRVTFILMG
jgi:hypothetical protein